MEDSLVASKTAEAAHAAAIATEAMANARRADLDAAVANGLQTFFEERSSKRFIDINRIPFICDDLRAIHLVMEKMSSNIWWIMLLGGSVGGTVLLGIGYLALKGIGA